ncbi:hypothetical protein [Bacillus sp. S/N-304-OC-R1]|uniref:DUF7686 domain-containing protein n=1 Tax=Bacillus sp. S/N-304-OC-R1 TaxID=2758034 RepID=UPI001C8ECFC8|nr:hypothetical protein [Bacillus sp. S/N-304-OC-R1]MBY0122303.1 hypothetical protein [Bacillus sp. S/N-304-OC-R1]
MEAAENIEWGYRFAVYGELHVKQDELLNMLIKKVKNGINVKQVETNVFLNGQEYHSIVNDKFIGVIEYDANSDGVPLVIIVLGKKSVRWLCRMRAFKSS